MDGTKVKSTVKRLIIQQGETNLKFEFEVAEKSIRQIDAFLNGIFDQAKAELLVLREEIVRELMGDGPHLPV